MRSDNIKAFIRDQRDLFWFVPERDLEQVSDTVLVETVLNYGSLDAVVTLVRLLGVDMVASIFARQIKGSARGRNNYHELTRHYFEQVFRRYAPRCFDPATT